MPLRDLLHDAEVSLVVLALTCPELAVFQDAVSDIHNSVFVPRQVPMYLLTA